MNTQSINLAWLEDMFWLAYAKQQQFYAAILLTALSQVVGSSLVLGTYLL